MSSTRCHIHTHICTHTQTQVYAQIHAHSCKHIHKHIYTHTHTLAVSSVILACIATKIVSISRMLGVGASCACAWKCSSSCKIHSFLFWAQLRAVYFRVPDVIFGSTPSSFMYCFTHCRHPSLEADRRPKFAESLFNFAIVETAWEPLEYSFRKLPEARFHFWK